MAKVLKTVGIVAGVVALAATGVGLAVGGATIIAGIGTASGIAAAASAVAALSQAGAGMLQKKPPAQGSLSETLIGANLPSPYVIGRTYTGGNLIHDVGYGGTVGGVPNPYRALVHEWSVGGPVQAVSPQVDFGAVGSYYSGFLTSTSQLGLTPQPAALAGAYGAIPGWGAGYKLSGHAATLWSLKFDKDGKKFASGLPRMGAIVTGPRAYDPRQDSTYPGGSGACRALNEATYVGGAAPGNPGCAAVTYALGRWQNGKLVFGPGFKVDEIDWAAWVAFMNVCDANGWTAGGVIYEPDSAWDNLKQICAAGGGMPVLTGGMLSVQYRAPRVSLDTIGLDDLADGEISIPGTRPWKERINTLVPRYRSEAHRWEYVQADEVTVASYVTADGERKVQERQYGLVQAKDQAAQLAAYDLVDAREITPIILPCKPRLQRYRVGDALTVGADLGAHTGLGGQLVLIVGRDPDPLTGKVTLTLATETSSKHAYALGLTATAPPVPSLVASEEMDSAAASGGRFRGEWLAGADYAIDDLFAHQGVTYRVLTAHTAAADTPPPNPNVQALTSGSSGLQISLSNEAHQLNATAAGAVSDYTGASCTTKVFLGTTDVTAGCTFTYANPFGLTGPFSGQPFNAAGQMTVTGGIDPNEEVVYLDVIATHTASGATISKRFSISKAKQGAAGAAARSVRVSADSREFRFDATGAANPAGQVSTFTAMIQNPTVGEVVYWQLFRADGTQLNANALLGWNGFNGVDPAKPLEAYAEPARLPTMTVANFETARGLTKGVTVKVYLAGGVLIDQVSLVRLADGAAGPAGASARSLALTASPEQIKFNSFGAITPASQPVTFKHNLQNPLAPDEVVYWSMFRGDGTQVDALAYLDFSGLGARHGTLDAKSGHANPSPVLTSANFNIARGTSDTLTVRAYLTDGTIRAEKSVTKVQDGPAGADGSGVSVTQDKESFTYTNGVLSPASQTATFTAVTTIAGTVQWTTSPNVKSGAGGSFTLNTMEIGNNAEVMVTATVGGKSAQGSIAKMADPNAISTPILGGSGGNIRDGLDNGLLSRELVRNDQLWMEDDGRFRYGAGNFRGQAKFASMAPVEKLRYDAASEVGGRAVLTWMNRFGETTSTPTTFTSGYVADAYREGIVLTVPVRAGRLRFRIPNGIHMHVFFAHSRDGNDANPGSGGVGKTAWGFYLGQDYVTDDAGQFSFGPRAAIGADYADLFHIENDGEFISLYRNHVLIKRGIVYVGRDALSYAKFYCNTSYAQVRDIVFTPLEPKSLSDPRSAKPIMGANLGYRYTGPVTYSADNYNATINVGAGSILMGDGAIPYNNLSAGVSGNPGTTSTYYLYTDDPTYAGGSRTLFATTDPDANFRGSNRVWMGGVTVAYPPVGQPPSGGSGGGGGGGGGGGYGQVQLMSAQ